MMTTSTVPKPGSGPFPLCRTKASPIWPALCEHLPEQKKLILPPEQFLPHPHGIFFPLSACISRIVFLLCGRGVSCSSTSGTPGMFNWGCGILYVIALSAHDATIKLSALFVLRVPVRGLTYSTVADGRPHCCNRHLRQPPNVVLAGAIAAQHMLDVLRHPLVHVSRIIFMLGEPNSALSCEGRSFEKRLGFMQGSLSCDAVFISFTSGPS
jgi:hypothetical protein